MTTVLGVEVLSKRFGYYSVYPISVSFTMRLLARQLGPIRSSLIKAPVRPFAFLAFSFFCCPFVGALGVLEVRCKLSPTSSFFSFAFRVLSQHFRFSFAPSLESLGCSTVEGHRLSLPRICVLSSFLLPPPIFRSFFRVLGVSRLQLDTQQHRQPPLVGQSMRLVGEPIM